jgi:hypothetical protein
MAAEAVKKPTHILNPFFIPKLVVGNRIYYSYPIRKMDRPTAESMVQGDKTKIIIRISDESRSQGGYYVVSVWYNNAVRHMNISRDDHEAGMSNLTEIFKRKYHINFDFSNFTLPIIRHDPSFRHTRTKNHSGASKPGAPNSNASARNEPGASKPGVSNSNASARNEPGAPIILEYESPNSFYNVLANPPNKGGRRHTRRSRSKKSKSRRSKKSKSRRQRK